MKVHKDQIVFREPHLQTEEGRMSQTHNERWKKLKIDIEKNGIINPLICTKDGDKYRLCMGMRRFIAGCILGIDEYEIEVVPDEEVETLIPLSFLKEEESPIVNGLYVDYEEDLTQYDINPRCVEYYLDIMIDKAIDLNDLCRLGYRTDFSKRGHIRVTCTGDSVESGQNMSNIYDPIDIVPPFGDDC